MASTTESSRGVSRAPCFTFPGRIILQPLRTTSAHRKLVVSLIISDTRVNQRLFELKIGNRVWRKIRDTTIDGKYDLIGRLFVLRSTLLETR